MLCSGTDPESYITEYTLKYQDKTIPPTTDNPFAQNGPLLTDHRLLTSGSFCWKGGHLNLASKRGKSGEVADAETGVVREHGTHTTDTARFWPWLSGDTLKIS